jgi:hydrogenase-4 component B
MENLGGLVKNMPYTSLIFLIGSISIAGLPPFNGFVSEWLTMQSLLFTSEVPSAILKISLGFASLAFALAIGTSAAVFLKVFGISFLGRARSNLSRAAREVPKVMLFSKAILGILCIVFGIIPSTGINLISYAFDLKSTHAALFGAIELQKNTKHNFSSLSMPAVVVMLTSLGVAVTAFLYIIGRRKSGAAVKKETKPMTTTETIPSSLERSSSLPAPNATTSASKAAPTWYSGYSDITDTKNQYSAAAFSQPIQVVFKILYRTKTRIIKTYYSEANPYIKKSIKVESKTIDIFENFFYAPIIFASIFTLDKIRKIQTGKINAYLLYIMITVILLLVAVRAGF